MQPQKDNRTNSKASRRPWRLVGTAVLIVGVGLLAVWYRAVRAEQSSAMKIPTFTAERGPLTISVLQAGTINAQQQEIIYNQVEGRTSIVWIIPEGSQVKKGDLLVELDSSSLEDQRIDQEIRVQNAEAAFINAKETLEVVKNQALSDVNEAMLNLEFAEHDLQKYEQGEYPIELDSARNDITIAEEELARAEETLKWSERLFAEKYISETELQADRLAASRARVRLQVAQNNLKLLQEYTYKRQIAQLRSNVYQAKMALERIQRRARADVVQAEANLKAREQEYNRERDKLAKIIDQIQKTKVYAPVDGMVVYATSARAGGRRMDDRQPLEEGVEVFERQELIYLPTANLYKAEVSIHEANLQKIRVGLPARITVDALLGKVFFGTVRRIAPLPDPRSMWLNPDLKVYNADVALEGEDSDLRTGLSCKVEIIVRQYDDTVYVPVQAVVRVDGRPTVYVLDGEGVQHSRQVEIGMDNGSMVAVLSGLEKGELVVLNPPLEGAVAQMGWLIEGAADANADAGSGSVSQRIREQLELTGNGTRPGIDLSPPAMPGQWPGRANRLVDPNAGQFGPQGPMFGPGQGRDRQSFGEGPLPQQMEQMRRRFEQMTPEQREAMRMRFQQGSSSGRQGRRPRESDGGSGGSP